MTMLQRGGWNGDLRKQSRGGDFWAQGIAWGGHGSPISQEFEAQRSHEFPAKPALTGG